MSNKHASKQHCLVGNLRPRSKNAKKRNKALAKDRRLERKSPQDLLLAA